MTKHIREHIRQTLAIDPAGYSLKVSENRLNSFGYALAGCLHMLRYAKNVRIQLLAAFLVVGVGLWLGLDAIEWALIVLVMGLNLFAEFVNTAIESAVNLASPARHEMAQIAKDIAAGAVLITTIMAVIIGGLILLPPLVEKLR